MRALLGELYDLYDKFTIDLYSAEGSQTGATIDNNSRACTLKLFGLEFVDCPTNEIAMLDFTGVGNGI